MVALVCSVCGASYTGGTARYICTRCGASIEPQPARGLRREALAELIRTGGEGDGVWRYRAMYPGFSDVAPVTMGEGGTPLLRACALENAYGIARFYLKNETLNPTGTYKDRFATLAVSLFRAENASAAALGSAGNAGSSVAAYAAKAGLPCYVILPEGGVFARAQQAMAYGARFIRARGEVNDCIELIEQGVERYHWRNACTTMLHNPLACEGYKSIVYELYRQLGCKLPDVILCPVGGGILISKVYRACRELEALGLVARIPRLVAVQAAGCPPVVWAFEHGMDDTPVWENPRTIAGSINDPVTFEGRTALHVIRASGGTAVAVTDEEILSAMRLAAAREAVLAEPASAAAIAAVKKLIDARWLRADACAVSIVTGSALRDLPLLAGGGE
ncbi:MAG: pyridoxal-phosphate dependent enzyme, partial [Clostridia bacterium]|nr:pyridoxal-phosphate dependent enzyme [Clostridia bacterium]